MSEPPAFPDPPPAPPPALPIPNYAKSVLVYRKPGWLTTLAVFGFIVAIGSMLVGLVGGMAGAVAQQVTRQSRTWRTATTMAGPPMVPQAYVAPRGYTPMASQTVQMLLTGQQSLSTPRLEQLDAIIADHGRDIIGLAEEEMNSQKIQARIVRVSQLPGGSGPPLDVFELSTGRLQISDNTAVFFDTGGQTIRSGGNTKDAAGQIVLRDDQVKAVVDRVRELTGSAMMDEQAQGLDTLLRQPGQRIVTPAISISGSVSQIIGATVDGDGVLTLSPASAAPIQLDAAGQVVVGGGAVAMTPTRSDRAATRRMIFYGLENFASAGVGVFLLIASISLLRQSPRSRPMLLIYATAKVVLAIVGAWMWGSFWGQLANIPAFSWWTAAAVGLAGIAFPLVLLVVLTRPAVKEYYEAMG